MPDEMPLKLEAGMPNTPAFAGLNAAVLHCLKHMDEIYEKEKLLAEYLHGKLMAIPNVRVFDHDPHDRLPVISFAINGMNAEDAGFALSESFGIDCRAGLHCAPLMHKALGMEDAGTIRFSLSYVNTEDEIDYAAEAVRKIAE
jgi:selenocysteine lyase/cysteine desulfurase